MCDNDIRIVFKNILTTILVLTGRRGGRVFLSQVGISSSLSLMKWDWPMSELKMLIAGPYTGPQMPRCCLHSVPDS